MRLSSKMQIYDTIVIGGGPAGYTAALYAARAGLSTLVLEKFSAGGQMTETSVIDNYPGFDEGIDGFSLGDKMKKGAEKYGAETVQTEVTAVSLLGDVKSVTTDAGEFSGRTVIIATGASHRHLGIDNESALVGRGVGYCAVCDGMLYRRKTVAVVGGGNSAAADAAYLSRICEKVYLIHRRDTLRATKIYHEPLMKTENVEFLWDSTVEELLFEKKLTGAKIKNVKTGELREIALDGLFVSIGRNPVTSIFEGQLALDNYGYVIAGEDTKTSVAGVFAAGDVRTKELRQVVTAAADGAVAAHYAEQYLAK